MIVREISLSDAAGVARVHVDSWRSMYRGIVSDDFIDGLTYEKAMEHFISIFRNQDNPLFGFVAEDDGRILGFAAGGPEKTGDTKYKGELYAIYILPEYQRQGIGLQLMQAVAGKLRETNIESMLAWVLADNPSRQFYAALGGKQLGKKMLEIGSREYAEVAYGWEDTTVLSANG